MGLVSMTVRAGILFDAKTPRPVSYVSPVQELTSASSPLGVFNTIASPLALSRAIPSLGSGVFATMILSAPIMPSNLENQSREGHNVLPKQILNGSTRIGIDGKNRCHYLCMICSYTLSSPIAKSKFNYFVQIGWIVCSG